MKHELSNLEQIQLGSVIHRADGVMYYVHTIVPHGVRPYVLAAFYSKIGKKGRNKVRLNVEVLTSHEGFKITPPIDEFAKHFNRGYACSVSTLLRLDEGNMQSDLREVISAQLDLASVIQSEVDEYDLEYLIPALVEIQERRERMLK